jgi:hypothetical protein
LIIKTILKNIIPVSIRKKRVEYKTKVSDYLLRKKILRFLERRIGIVEDDFLDVYTFLKHNPFSVFPYEYIKKYNYRNIAVYTDTECDMKYVMNDNRRLYFKHEMNEVEIQKYYNGLLIEQDIDSPHRYEYKDFKVNDGDIVADVGVAEGNFALSVIERVKKIYLFESDKSWIEALEKTFELWKEKVVIINKYVSNISSADGQICLDDYFSGERIDFLKADIEGAERLLIMGSERIFSEEKERKIVICTYHCQNDAEEIERTLSNMRFKTEFSKGYMIFKYDTALSPPYLRKGLIRGWKALG